MRRLRRAHERHIKEQAKWRKKFKKQAIAAGTAAVITLGAGVGINKVLAAYTPDPHELPVSQDTDGDLLADPEEAALAYLDFNPDQNRNAIPDGVELAKICASAFKQLPICGEADPKDTCKGIAYTYGLETCDICGETVNMGGAWVTNPSLALTVRFPILAIHYMEHGSFSYAGSIHDGRIDVPALLQALELRLPYEPNDHQLPVPNDADADLLSNKEEFAIGYQPFNDDQNKNEIPDGIELAKRCADIINQLPEYEEGITETYRADHPCRGIELCDICGQEVNMCGVEITNPQIGLTINVNYIALHYMEHGSFDYGGHSPSPPYEPVNNGRLDVPLLMRVLELRYPYDPNEHQLPLDYVVEPVGQLAPDANDLDGDLLADSEELKSGFDLYDPDQDDNLIPDGIELAKQCAVAIGQLPTSIPSDPNKPYKILYMTDGLETCEICGLTIPMDYWTIVNPRLGLTIEIVPVMAAHYMEHGSFSYWATFHTGRVDVAALVQALEIPQRCGDLGTLYLPVDLNKDCKVDSTDFAEFADKWLHSTEPGQD